MDNDEQNLKREELVVNIGEAYCQKGASFSKEGLTSAADYFDHMLKQIARPHLAGHSPASILHVHEVAHFLFGWCITNSTPVQVPDNKMNVALTALGLDKSQHNEVHHRPLAGFVFALMQVNSLHNETLTSHHWDLAYPASIHPQISLLGKLLPELEHLCIRVINDSTDRHFLLQSLSKAHAPGWVLCVGPLQAAFCLCILTEAVPTLLQSINPLIYLGQQLLESGVEFSTWSELN